MVLALGEEESEKGGGEHQHAVMHRSSELTVIPRRRSHFDSVVRVYVWGRDKGNGDGSGSHEIALSQLGATPHRISLHVTRSDVKRKDVRTRITLYW